MNLGPAGIMRERQIECAVAILRTLQLSQSLIQTNKDSGLLQIGSIGYVSNL